MKHLFLCCALASIAFSASAQNAPTQLSEENEATATDEDFVDVDQEALDQTGDDQAEVYDVQWGGGWQGSGRKQWNCWARNNRGQTFSGRNWDRQTARRQAMSRCSARSNAASLVVVAKAESTNCM